LPLLGIEKITIFLASSAARFSILKTAFSNSFLVNRLTVSNGILDIKREERRAEVHNIPNQNTPNHNSNNNHNLSWFRPRDKSGRFMCSTAITTSTITTTSSSSHKLRDERGRFISAGPTS
jgi:hypothetical protein